MKTLQHIVFGALLALVTGCASLGLEPAQTVEQKIAYAYGVHTAVLSAATDELKAKDITVADAEKILGMADEARGILDAARTINAAGNPGVAEDRLKLATTVLEELQLYLKSHAKGSP